MAVTPEEREYIEASRAERERRNADEQARAEHEQELERRSFRRLRALVAVLAVAALIAIGLTVFATSQRGRAQSEERRATARELAAASVSNLDVDPERSILLALEAIDRARSVGSEPLPEAVEALHRAVTASRIERSFPGVGGALDWSPQGVFVTEGKENEGIVDVRDAATGDRVLPPWDGHDADINDVQFSPDGSLLATAGEDGALKIWDPATGDLRSSVTGEGQVFGPSFSADGSLVSASWPAEEMVRIADPSTGKVTTQIPGVVGFPFETALDPDGRSVAVATGDIPIVTIFDVSSAEPRFELRGHSYPVGSIAWDADGRRIATGSFDSSVRIWHGRTGRLEIELLGHSGTVISVDWSPDGSRLVTSASDGTAKVWEIGEAGGRELMSLSGQDTRSGLLAVFSPDGQHVIGGNGAISAVNIWDVGVSGDAEWANVPTDLLAPVDVAFLPDGNVVAPTDRGAVAVWDLASPDRPIRTIGPGSGGPEPVVQIAVNRHGTRLATVRNFTDVGSVWDPRTGDLVFEFRAPRGEITRHRLEFGRQPLGHRLQRWDHGVRRHREAAAAPEGAG